jgi:hypothetical protein
MRRGALLVLAVLGCGTQPYLPDGGRPRVVCTSSLTVIPVKTIDITGKPVDAATVTAVNQSSGKSQTGTTNGNGDTAAITDELGVGQVSITAQAGALATQMSFLVQIACDECDCTAIPASATVILQ